MADNHNVAHLVSTYFHLGLAYSEILAGIACQLGIIISKRTLHRILRSGYLYRRKHKSNIVDVCLFITEQLSEYGSLHGYRWMHASCVRQGYVISREEVRLILSVLDAAGVNIRKRRKLRRRQYHSKGPNSTWHMDGYDKLKPYGLCISGAIDGFSRKLIWLKTYCTNNNPKVIAGYYLEAMKEIGGVPAVVRADCGTENGIVEVIQRSLVPGNSFRYGRSTTNQRIECWWSFLRRQCIQYWMDIMEDIRDQGLFSGDVLDKSLVQYCFTDILQGDLCEVMTAWNSHSIRRCTNQRVPNGRPIVMYSMPELYGVQDYKHTVTNADIDICSAECVFRQCPCDETVYELCAVYMHDCNFSPPTSVDEAGLLYRTLRNCIRNDLNSA